MVSLNDNFTLRDQGVSNALSLGTTPRHRWYFVKEGFSPKLVEQALETELVGLGDLLLDPFSGSGTVPLAGALGGRRALAFEVNPFLRFVSAVKLQHVPAGKFTNAAKRVLRAAERQSHSSLEGFSTFTEGNRWNRWLFPRPVLRAFESGRQYLSEIDGDQRDLVKLALLGAAMDCCNATRDGKCLRYKQDWLDRQATAADFRARFEGRFSMMADDLEQAPLDGADAKVDEGDSRLLVGRLARRQFRLCVTSPPYLNSFDYSDVYRPELFLGGFVDSTASLMRVRLKTVRSHVQAKWDDPTRSEFGVLYRDCMEHIRDVEDDLWDRRLPLMIQAYFEDMETLLRGLRAAAKDRASAWIVVSTSAYAGVEIPVDLILAEIGQRAGWYLREVGVLRYLRSASQHVKHVSDPEKKSVPLRESVIILDATRPRARRKSS